MAPARVNKEFTLDDIYNLGELLAMKEDHAAAYGAYMARAMAPKDKGK